MNYATVGQKIKAKYPQYQDISDEQLGQMMLTKYPQYRDMAENVFERVVDSPLLPILGTILGGGAGALIAPATAGASLPFGAAAGYGGGKVISEGLQNLMGLQTQAPQEQLNEGLTGFGTAMAAGEGAALLRAIINPMGALGEIRNVSSGGKTTSSNTQEEAMQKMKSNKYYKYSSPETQLIAEDQLNNLFKGLPENPRLTQVYQELTPFERSSNAYKSLDPLAKGTEYASRAVRDVVGNQLPFIAKKATDVMQGINTAMPVVKKVAPWLAGGGGALGFANYILNRLRPVQ